jgi:hypothetical protein
MPIISDQPESPSPAGMTDEADWGTLLDYRRTDRRGYSLLVGDGARERLRRGDGSPQEPGR